MLQEMVKEWRQQQRVDHQQKMPASTAMLGASKNLALVSCTKSANLLQNLSCNLDVRLSYHTPCNVDALCGKLPEKCSKMWTVTSSLPGMGKTTSIRNSSNPNYKLQTLCINGEVSRDLLITSLKELSLQPTTLLHIDIGMVQNPETLNVLLFELLILGCLKSNLTGVFHLTTSNVAIEIANTLGNQLALSLPVCKWLRQEYLTWDLTNFRVSDEKDSDVQVVCNYLVQLEANNLDVWNLSFSHLLGRSAETISSFHCQELLNRHFIRFVQEVELISFTILEMFIRYAAHQLQELSNSAFFTPENLAFMGAMSMTRTNLVNSILDRARDLSLRSVKTWLHDHQQINPIVNGLVTTHAATDLTMAARMGGLQQWSDSNHVMLFFQMGGPITVLYRHVEFIPHSIQQLIESQKLRSEKTKPKDFSVMNSKELYEYLWPILHTKKPAAYKTDYALTPDNLLKMALIYKKVMAHVPVVIMGETGCGKTSLLQALAQYCDVKFFCMTLHAGTSENDIRKFVAKAEADAIHNKKVWAFLDEINACDHLGFLNGLICHHVLNGRELDKNLSILAACNPYRLHDSGKQHVGLATGEILQSSSTEPGQRLKFAYSVRPLPEAMIVHVFDFGLLSAPDERAYLAAMVKETVPGTLISFVPFIELLVHSQAMLRLFHGEASVSLRDVSRCISLFKWFCTDVEGRLMVKADKKAAAKGANVSQGSKARRAALLAFSHCYYYRLDSENERLQYRTMYANVMNKARLSSFTRLINFRRFTQEKFAERLRREQMDLLNRMDIPPGVAKNQALLENVFVTLVCILNCIPLFVVGKPGSGKTLSLQLIYSNLRGTDSKDPYFHQLPHMYMLSYQGSESSTSKGILKVFEKAYRCVNDSRNGNVVVVVVLDEVGLAEISSNNPLKVLHGLLEPNGEQQVAVVGISNWSLDAAKMNRAIHLSQPDPSEDDLFATSVAILESYGSWHLYGSLISELRSLAKSYYEYQAHQSHPNFHGLRDFYSLIKLLHHGKQNTQQHWSRENLARAVWRNFGGSPDDIVTFSQILQANLQYDILLRHPPQVLQLVERNLEDKEARHLMLITTGDSAIGILEHKRRHDENFVMIFGSSFKDDCSDDYAYMMLSSIILHMEAGRCILLKGLERIWSSLYDMLNQHYRVVGGRRSCRIAIDAYSNPMCFVHDNFRCIVVVESSQVPCLDPPFLNRFEKQVLTDKSMLSKEQNEMVETLRKWVISMAEIVSGDDDDSYTQDANYDFRERDLFAGYYPDVLPSLVLHQFNDRKNTTSYCQSLVLDRCKEDLLRIAYMDGMVRAHYSKASRPHAPDAAKWTQKYFDEQRDQKSLQDVIHDYMEQGEELWHDEKGFKLVINTRSNIHMDIKNDIFSSLKNVNAQILKLGDFSSERQLQVQLQNWFKNESSNMLVLQANAVLDNDHIPLVKAHVERDRADSCQGNNSKSVKHIMFIIHSHRSDKETQSRFSFLSGWQQITLDQLQKEKMDIRIFLNHTIPELVESEMIPLSGSLMVKVLTWSFLCIKYPTSMNSAIHCQEMVQKICADEQLLECFKQHAVHWLKANTEKVWQTAIICNRGRLVLTSNLHHAFAQFIEEQLRQPIARLIYILEKGSALGSYFSMDDTKKHYWHMMVMDPSIISLESVPIPVHPEGYSIKMPLHLLLPFSPLYANHVEKNFRELYEVQRMTQNKQDPNSLPTLPIDIGQDIRVSLHESMELILSCIEINLEDYVSDFAKIYAPYISDEMHASEAEIFEWILRENLAGPIQSPGSELHTLVWEKGAQLAAQMHLVATCFPAEYIIGELADIKRCKSPRKNFDQTLVFESCKRILPTKQVIQRAGGIHSWTHQINNLIKLASSLAGGSPRGPNHELLMLMLCTLWDFASLVIIPLAATTESLESLAKWFVNHGLVYTTLPLIERVLNMVPDINSFTGEVPQRAVWFRFLASFFDQLLELPTLITNKEISRMAYFLFDCIAPTCSVKSSMLRIVQASWSSTTGVVHEPKCPQFMNSYCTLFVSGGHWKSDQPYILLGDAIYETVQPTITDKLMLGEDTEDWAYRAFVKRLSEAKDELVVNVPLNIHVVCSIALVRATLDFVAKELLAVHANKHTNLHHPQVGSSIAGILHDGFTTRSPYILALKQYLLKVLKAHYGMSILDVSHLALKCQRNRALETYACMLDWEMLKEVTNPLGFNPFNLSSSSSSSSASFERASKSLWDMIYSQDENPPALIWKANAVEQAHITTTVASELYLIQATRELNAQEISGAQWLTDAKNLQYWLPEWRDAIRIFLGTRLMALRPEMDTHELRFKVLLAHVLLVVTSLPSDSPLQGYMMLQSSHLQEAFVLTCPNSLIAALRAPLLVKEKLAEYKCRCGYIYTIGNCTRPASIAKCPECKEPIGGQHHNLVSGSKESSVNSADEGYILDSQAPHDEFYKVRGLDFKGYRVLRIVVHYCLLIGTQMGQADDLVLLAKLLELPPRTEMDKVVAFLKDMIEMDLKKLDQLLRCNREVTCQYLHILIASLAKVSNTGKLMSQQARKAWEDEFQMRVKVVSSENVHDTATKYLQAHSVRHNITELLEERLMSPFPSAIAGLTRIAITPSSQNFKSAYMQDAKRIASCPLLQVVFHHQKTLADVKHLVPLVLFLSVVHELLSSKITRPEATSITMGSLVKEKKELKDLFLKFAEAWNAVRGKVSGFECTEFKHPIPAMGFESAVALCLVEPHDQGIYITAILDHLRNHQNAFLEEVAGLESFDKINIHDRNEDHGASSIRVQMCKVEDVIDFDDSWAEHMICKAAMADLRYGHGLESLYDDTTIQQRFSDCLVSGKAHLKAEWLEFLYKHEAFNKHATILADVAERIKQKPFQLKTMQSIQREIDLSVAGAGRYLAMLDLLLGFLRRTGGDPLEPLAKYCQRWLDAEAHLITKMSVFDQIQLQHIVSLYEGLEDCASVGVQSLVNSSYRSPLTPQLMEELENAVEVKKSHLWSKEIVKAQTRKGNNQKIPAQMLQAALRRFMFRYLVADTLRSNLPLSIYITDERLIRWPENVIDIVDDIFPPSLLLEHTSSTYGFLCEMCSKQENA